MSCFSCLFLFFSHMIFFPRENICTFASFLSGDKWKDNLIVQHRGFSWVMNYFLCCTRLTHFLNVHSFLGTNFHFETNMILIRLPKTTKSSLQLRVALDLFPRSPTFRNSAQLCNCGILYIFISAELCLHFQRSISKNTPPWAHQSPPQTLKCCFLQKS